ncbi:hypothetical protein T552_02320 [Pneumocystis carinii B80]|uniref:Uncharacterized protein n=1 Tax=Pneumocystis carinii (strain B80) TaxID=1408658 RepID=A0A0W4ZG55_PNEC8|nr:hypothetical protein T552_02320 [Pneumocystis carinii B80]KTW27337.1 hypothetical protein T552_02320 [Pneumocystis carinii B80]
MNQEIVRIILEKNTSKSSKKHSSSHEISNDSKVHLLPCQIHWDGPADVSKYFNIRSMPDNSTYYATFRGHGLEGNSFILPSTYEGVIYDTDDHVSQDFEQLNDDCCINNTCLNNITVPTKKWHQIGSFSAFNIWKQIPNYDSEFRTCIRTLKEWINLANIVNLQFFSIKPILMPFSRFIQ